MPRYQKKPVTIQAWQMGKDAVFPDFIEKAFLDDTFDISPYMRGKVLNGKEYEELDVVAKITTLEGVMDVRDGDYIIQGVHGELYPCKSDIFEETYIKID